jgi:hypothetical protein
MSISVICACKNRNSPLHISLNSWLNFKEITEFIIVDWSSDEPLGYLTKLDPRIKIVRVSDKKYFNQPQPLNLAASIATGDYILKLDTDYITNPYFNFIERYFPTNNSFTSGVHNIKSPEYYNEETGLYMIDKFSMTDADLQEYFNSYSPYFKYLTGFLFVSRENFNKVGGYNENLGKYYAFEDSEIYKRLENLGLTHNKIDYDYNLIHIPHPDIKRVENFEGYDEEDREWINSIKYDPDRWQSEYFISQSHIKQNAKMIGEINYTYVNSKTKWEVIRVDEQNYFAEEIKVENKLNGFSSVYYVSLEECGNRRRSLEFEFDKYDIKPKAIISKRFSECNDIITGKYVYQLNDGTKGCCVSHLKAIKEWYENTNENYGFFCEDDLSLETIEYWNFTWQQFIESIPDDAECVQLLTIRNEFDTFEIRERYWDDWGATAYIMTRDYATKIINTYIKDDSYHLEIPNQDVMPLIENILFASIGKTYTYPIFVENIDFKSTFVGNDDDVSNGQKTNHKKSRDIVLNYWKNKNIVEKTELEVLLTQYSCDTENPEHNFSLGIWYENEGHTAPALSYYLRCAERACESNPDLAYEALIRGSYCYEKQGTRDGSARSMLWQAQAFKPDRPEAHFLLARFAERREWWQDCYMNADLALRHCNFDNQPLRTNVEYPGQYGLLYLKSVAAWWWGKGKETRLLLQEIKNNHQIRDEDFDLIQSRLMELATGYISESELKYTKNSGQELRFKFDGCEKIERNYSQAFQDLFVLTALNGKENGTYLEIGAQEPFYQNNTALLETQFAWKGVSIEIRQDLCQMFSQQRKNTILCQDATKINYPDLLNKFDYGSTIDYLQVDCEPSKTTFEILLMIPFNDYKFRIITYEHDYYVDLTNSYRDKSREYLMSKGYKLLVSNVALNEWSPFEDWWYHPDLVDSSIVEQIKNISDITDIRHYMIKT